MSVEAGTIRIWSAYSGILESLELFVPLVGTQGSLQSLKHLILIYSKESVILNVDKKVHRYIRKN